MKKSKFLTLGCALAVQLLCSPGTFAAGLPPDAPQEAAPGPRYNLQAAYDLANLIFQIAKERLSNDPNREQHTKDVLMHSFDNSDYIMHTYEYNGARFEFNKELPDPFFWNIHLNTSIVPENMSSRLYYINKLDLTGFDNSNGVLSITSDASTITINFRDDLVEEINLKVDPGVD